MARSERLRVFTYDISSNISRRRVAKILENVASRVQFSVFETRLSDAKVAAITKSITPHLDESDSLRVYTIGKSGEKHCDVSGAGAPIENEAGYWLF